MISRIALLTFLAFFAASSDCAFCSGRILTSDDTFNNVDLSLFEPPGGNPQNSGKAILVKSESSVDLKNDSPVQSTEENQPANSEKAGQPKKQFRQIHALDPRHPTPAYPKFARQNGWQGTVILKALVERDGNPSQVVVEKTSGYPALDQTALETVRKWEFEAPENAPLSRSFTIPIKFALKR